jgi:diguanylate cyclase
MTEEIGESFFNLLRIVCKGLDGQSVSLDKSLSELRAHLMKSSDEPSEALIKEIEQDIRILHLERQENSQDFLDVGLNWQRRLTAAKLEPDQKQRLLDLENDFRDSKSRVYLLPAKFKSLLELQRSADQLLQANATDLPDNSPLLRRISDEIAQLLSQVSPSQGLLTSYKQLLTQAENGFEMESLPIAIYQIAQFIDSALEVKGDDFSNYLQGLNKQLSEVQGFIEKSQGIDTQSSKARSVADGKVRDSIVNIREVVLETKEVEKLQEALKVQLDHIVGAMDSLKNEDKKRENTLQENYDSLKRRVTEMEEEAERVQEYVEEQRKTARVDALTELPNRMAYNEIISHEIENFKRYNNPLSLVICDLDHFKIVNDSYGHLAGDKVLNLVARILCKGTRSSDFVTRYGGEEFAIILPSTDAEKALKSMDKIRRLICKSPFNYRGEPIAISMSFGVSEAIEGDTIESLFSKADAALYKAKANGRNEVCIG